MLKPAIIVIVLVGLAIAVVLWSEKTTLMDKSTNLHSVIVTTKPAGDQAAAIAVVESRLKTGEGISSPELGEIAVVRQITIDQPVLTGRMFNVTGTVGNTKYMTDYMINATNVSAEGILDSETNEISANGNFDVQFELIRGPGLYEISFQAPLLEEHEVDDISYALVAAWSVRVQ